MVLEVWRSAHLLALSQNFEPVFHGICCMSRRKNLSCWIEVFPFLELDYMTCNNVYHVLEYQYLNELAEHSISPMMIIHLFVSGFKVVADLC